MTWRLGDDSAFPILTPLGDRNDVPRGFPEISAGLSRRELFAALAMQSLVSRIPWPMPDDCSEEMICAQAVVLADALLKGLIT
jgi:hypothetical protein